MKFEHKIKTLKDIREQVDSMFFENSQIEEVNKYDKLLEMIDEFINEIEIEE